MFEDYFYNKMRVEYISWKQNGNGYIIPIRYLKECPTSYHHSNHCIQNCPTV